MNLLLNQDQEMLQKTARKFVDERSPLSRVRTFRDKGDPRAYSRDVWKEMAEMGWLGIHLPEAQGGINLGIADLCLVLEAAGRQLMPEPLVEVLLLGAETLRRAGAKPHQLQRISTITGGDEILVLAHEESRSRYDRHRVECRAEFKDNTYLLSGRKHQVLGGFGADTFLITARSEGAKKDPEGYSLFLVPAETPGLNIQRQWRVDDRNSAILEFDNMPLGPEALVGQKGAAGQVIEEVYDRATVGLCAYMLGAADAAFEATLSYLKERSQFGVRIGSFQSLQHRAARLYGELVLARSALRAAALSMDENENSAQAMASLAKVHCSETFNAVANEAIQMHGGIGMTDEHDIGFYLKRARAFDATFGDAAWHRNRWAELHGY